MAAWLGWGDDGAVEETDQAGQRGAPGSPWRSREPWQPGGPWHHRGSWPHRQPGERWPRWPLRREREGRLAGGVAAGIAKRSGVDVNVIRIGFAVATLLGGLGATLYVIAWLVIPAQGDDTNILSAAVTDKRGLTLAAGLTSVLITLLIIASALSAVWFTSIAWPLIICAGGTTLIWRNASAGEQATMRRVTDSVLGVTADAAGSRIVWRLTAAGVLTAMGLSALLTGHPTYRALVPLAGVALLMAAIVVALGPWWLRIGRDLVEERQARVRAEERADIAARVHDSVLQTLALIQRRADQPQQVISLARAQERELRSWLFSGRAPGLGDEADATIDAGVRAIQADVESRHGVAVETVVVGDCELDDDLRALLAAAREATVNAAKWSGAQVVAVFAEVERERVSVFVRDRGKGFDPELVPEHRKGLAESVIARMTRRGGTASVRSAPGEGTEVSLSMPRAAADRQPTRARP